MSWNLNDLSRNPERDLKRLEKEVKTVIKRFALFPERGSGEDALLVLEAYDALLTNLKRIELLAELRISENASDEHARALTTRIEHLTRNLDQAYDRLIEWIRTADDTQIEPLLTSRFAHTINHIRRIRKHILPLTVEQALSMTSRASEATILDTLQAHQTASFLGKDQPLSMIQPYVSHPDPAVREAAARALLSGRLQHKETLRVILHEHVMRVHTHRVTLRGYANVREATLMEEGISREAYETLLTRVKQAFPLYARAFKLKHAILSQRKPYPYSRYHVYATHPLLHTKTYSFNEALRIIEKTLARTPWKDYAHTILKANHASITPAQGKYGGAFCADNPHGIPYMLLNYTGSITDILTLAHELGHCIHDQLIQQDIPLLERHPRLSIAELASTSIEGLVLHTLQEEAEGEYKLALLLYELDEWYATVLRQALFSIIEDLLSTRIPKGERMSTIAKAYTRLMKHAFPDMQHSEAYAEEWLAIPHLYHHPYYVFTYAWTFLTSRLIIPQLHTQRMRERFSTILSQGWRITGEDALRMLTKSTPEDAFTRAFNQLERLIKRIEREATRAGYALPNTNAR